MNRSDLRIVFFVGLVFLTMVLMVLVGNVVQTNTAPRDSSAAMPDQEDLSLDLEGQLLCTADAKDCGDGTYVGRDPNNECQFFECSSIPECSNDLCEAGESDSIECTTVDCIGIDCSSTYKPCFVISGTCPSDCGLDETPGEISCPQDLKQCSDGSFVGRDPGEGCKFETCGRDQIRNQLTEEGKQIGCRADYDANGVVEIADLSEFALLYSQSDIDCRYDVAGDDCFINIIDLAHVANVYLDQSLCK